MSASASGKYRDREEYMEPVSRNRSSSATESSKPIAMLQRRQTHTGNKPMNFSPSGGKFIYIKILNKLNLNEIINCLWS